MRHLDGNDALRHQEMRHACVPRSSACGHTLRSYSGVPARAAARRMQALTRPLPRRSRKSALARVRTSISCSARSRSTSRPAGKLHVIVGECLVLLTRRALVDTPRRCLPAVGARDASRRRSPPRHMSCSARSRRALHRPSGPALAVAQTSTMLPPSGTPAVSPNSTTRATVFGTSKWHKVPRRVKAIQRSFTELVEI